MTWYMHTDIYKYDAHTLFETIGLIPYLLDEDAPGTAIEQFSRNHPGGAWLDMPGFKLDEGAILRYHGDPPMFPIGQTQFKGDTVLVYPHAWVCVKHPDKSFEVARLD